MKLGISIGSVLGGMLMASIASAQTAPASAAGGTTTSTSRTSTVSTSSPAPATPPVSATPASPMPAPAASSTTTSTTSTTTAPTVPMAPASPPAASPTTTSGVLSLNEPTTTVQDLPTTEEGSPINRPLLVTGAVLLVGSYAAGASVGYSSSRHEDQNNLYYPIVGPWMDLANRDTDVRPGRNETLNKVLLIADGVGQGLGALMAVSSFFVGERTTRHWYLIGNENVQAAPSSVGSGYGFAAVGQF